MSIGVNNILAISSATFPCPIMTAVSTSRFNFKLFSSGNPLYQPTNFRAGITFFRFSPGMPSQRSCAAP